MVNKWIVKFILARKLRGYDASTITDEELGNQQKLYVHPRVLENCFFSVWNKEHYNDDWIGVDPQKCTVKISFSSANVLPNKYTTDV